MKLATVRKLAMALPEVSEEPHHDFGSFRVRGKIFATMPPGGAFVHLFVSEQVREQALSLYPAFTGKLMWGSKVLGVKVSLAEAQAEAVQWMVREAWTHKAPKSLQIEHQRVSRE